MGYYGILSAADSAYAAMYIATHPSNVNMTVQKLFEAGTLVFTH